MNSKAVRSDSSGFQAATTLPMRVAGIVFWGLVLIGLLVVMPMLQYREHQILQQQQSSIDRFMYDLSQAIAQDAVVSLNSLIVEAEHLAADSETIRAITLRVAGKVFRIGTPAPEMDRYDRALLLPAQVPEAGGRARLTFYLTSLESQIAQSRKELVLGMGGLFLLFGLVLQKVLYQVLTRPFQHMVDAARAFSGGDQSVRFDEQRKDEFGYLGSFINQALDYSLEQRDALNRALEQAWQTELKLYEEKERAVVTLHSIGEAVITTDGEGHIEYLNPVAEKITGWSLHEVKGSPLGKLLRLIDEDSGRPLPNSVDLCLERGEMVVGEDHRLLIRNDGGQVAIADSAAPIRNQEGGVIGVVMVFRDVGQARQLARQLSYQASHDPLTGLFNRREFEAELEQLLESARNQGSQHALCYLDLDQFKIVNDVCGHGAGDELLRQLSELLHGQIREADMLARLGGDEFGVLLSHCNLDQALRIAENLRSAVRAYRFVHGDKRFEVGVSVGVVGISEASRSADELMSAADIACYAAKDRGRNRVHLYQPGDNEVAERRGDMNWVGEIQRALDEARFELLYQPIVPLSGKDTVRPHYELLLRMCSADDGEEILPMAFIPAAERYNLMPDLDRWVVEQAMQSIGRAGHPGERAIYMINLSGQSLCNDRFVEFLEQRLSARDIEAGDICFEIAERAAITNLRRIGEAVKRLKKHGCLFALDDFGGGLSSFGHLKDLAVDYLMIDGALVQDMHADDVDAAMVRAINDIGHVMGVKTVAKMLETQATLAALQGLGVDFGQGHGIAPPQPLERLFERRADEPRLSLVRRP